jgi:ferredoxin
MVMPSPSEGLVVDRIACTGHGICASLLPDAVTLDEWGYPSWGTPRPTPS